MKAHSHKFWTFGGGKGGVGKSFLTASTGVVLAQMGKSVIAVDADLGSANLHTYVGIKNPERTLLDILEERVPVEEGLLPTSVPGLRLLSCAGDILGMADPESSQKERIIKFISELDADYILVDLGAGTSYNVLDFFNMSDEGVVIVSPDPASMQNAYAFIKSSIYRRIQRKFGDRPAVAAALSRFRDSDESVRPRTMLEFYNILCASEPDLAESVAAVVDSYRPLMIINMAGSEQDQRVAEIIQSASKRFLNVDIRYCGIIVTDPAVRRAIQRMEFLDFGDAKSKAAQQILGTVNCLLNSGISDHTPARAESDQPVPKTPTMGLTDRLDFLGRQFHIQTEDLGFTGRSITTQVFCEGKVIFTTKSEYPSAVNGRGDRNLITEMMRKQHFNVIRELENKKSQMTNVGG